MTDDEKKAIVADHQRMIACEEAKRLEELLLYRQKEVSIWRHDPENEVLWQRQLRFEKQKSAIAEEVNHGSKC